MDMCVTRVSSLFECACFTVKASQQPAVLEKHLRPSVCNLLSIKDRKTQLATIAVNRVEHLAAEASRRW